MARVERPIIRVPDPKERSEFTGERFIPGLGGEIEHEHLHRYFLALDLSRGRDVLDVASGEGYGSALLATVARSVVGVELVPEVVDQAARNYRAENLTYRVGDCGALPLEDGSVDVVVSMETLEHLPDQARFLAEVKRVLRPKGLLLLSSPVRDIYSPDNPNPFHIHELGRDELRALVENHFQGMATFSQGPTIGSALLLDADPESRSSADIRFYWRDEDGRFGLEDQTAHSPYTVLVASDGPLPTLRSSLLQDRPYMARLLGRLNDTSREAERLGGELAEARSTFSRLQRSAEAETQRRQGLEHDLDQLRLDTESSRTERRVLGEQRDELTLRLTRATEAVTRLDQEVERLRAALGEATRWTWQTLPSKVVKGLKRGARLRPSSLLRRGVGRELRQRLEVKRIDASGYFDSRYYLTRNPDVAQAGLDPVRHYVEHGAAEGRNPHPMFDTSYYREQNREILNDGANPLAHFLETGLKQGTRPHPAYSAEQYRSAIAERDSDSGEDGNHVAGRTSPVSETPEPRIVPPPIPARFRPRQLEAGHRAEAAAPHPKMRTLVLSHVLPFPPRAGNEYRIHRMVSWLASQGHEVHLVVCPLPGEVLGPADIAQAANQYPNFIVLLRDGELLYQSTSSGVSAMLQSLHGVPPRPQVEPVAIPAHRTQKILGLEATFCPDHLVDLVLRLEQSLKPGMVMANYIFLSRVLPLLRTQPFKIIDTIDVFSTKASKVVQFGISDDLALSPEEETSLLERADLVIAIQPEEERELRALVPHRRVVTAGVDFAAPKQPSRPTQDPIVLCVGSGNPMNVKGLKDFLSLGWPIIRAQVPDARLWIAGQVGETVERGIAGVEPLGRVEDLDALYTQARVVVNPAVAGTGLKIKTLEALSRSRPVVVWPSGVDGVAPALRRFCDVATNWYDFGQRVARRLGVEEAWSAKQRAEILRQLSPEMVYGELKAALDSRSEGPSAPDARQG